MLLLISLLLGGCQQETIAPTELSSPTEAASPERETDLAFKGMELYSWQDETGEWAYSILIGTNRVKSMDEILAKPLDFEEVKAALSKMAVGESVFWFNRALESSDEEALILSFPPKEVVEALKQHASTCQVTLHTQDE